jgi:hypothetical protein
MKWDKQNTAIEEEKSFSSDLKKLALPFAKVAEKVFSFHFHFA